MYKLNNNLYIYGLMDFFSNEIMADELGSFINVTFWHVFFMYNVTNILHTFIIINESTRIRNNRFEIKVETIE